MPSLAHEVLVVQLREHPERLSVLLRAFGLPPLPEGLTVSDSTLRRVDPVELRPDLLLARGSAGPWVLVEVQLDVDPVKQRKWPLAAAMLLDERGVMGDVVVLTSQRRVAEWAQEVAVVSGPLGTRYGLVPVVVTLTGDTAEPLLDEAHPELAFFAAFAMHERHGPIARRVVTRALQLAARLPEPLQQAQLRAIFNVLSEPMLAWLEEMSMQPETTLESEAFRALRERLEARGEAQALLTVLGARGFALHEAAQARVRGCQDRALLERWLARAVTAPSLDEVFSDG